MSSASEHLHDARTGQHLTFVEAGPDSDRSLLRVHVRLDPGGRVPRHIHVRQDERVEVLAGSVAVTCGGKTRTLHTGDAMDVPRRKIHVVRNAGGNEARFLLEVRPARRMEQAMRTLFAITGRIGSLAIRRAPREGS
jgi:quercetin dioxygenase-like cupin family protein